MPGKSTKRKLPAKRSLARISLQQKAYDAINTPIVVVDAQSSKIEFINESFEQLCGYTKSSAKDLMLSKLFAGKAKDKVSAIVDILSGSDKESEVNDIDIDLRKRSGRKISVNIFAKSLLTNGRRQIILSIHDISDLKKYQEEREVAVKEMSHVAKLADIGRLAAGVAHELNNPLMIIQGFAENIELLCESGDFDQNEIKWQVNPILKATDRMAKIIAQMTRLARDDDMNLTLVDLIEVTEDVLRLVNNQFKYNNVQVERIYSGNHIVRCDPNQIEQIILNILNNAIHALVQNDSRRKLTLRISQEGSEEVLSIWNNGPEIPDEIQDKIMTPFFTTKEVGEGTGLGLSVSFGIMKAHGGSLKFKSSADNGTVFKLVFPMPTGLEEVRSETAATVLVVDDDDLARQVLVSKLTRFGYTVLQAESGEAAIDIMQRNSDVVCVFTDVNMPNMDGASLVKQLRMKDHNLMIFAVSGYAGARNLESQMSRHGINGFVKKPIDHDKFSTIVKQIESELLKRRGFAA